MHTKAFKQPRYTPTNHAAQAKTHHRISYWVEDDRNFIGDNIQGKKRFSTSPYLMKK
jgi:hypothetical protein